MDQFSTAHSVGASIRLTAWAVRRLDSTATPSIISITTTITGTMATTRNLTITITSIMAPTAGPDLAITMAGAHSSAATTAVTSLEATECNQAKASTPDVVPKGSTERAALAGLAEWEAGAPIAVAALAAPTEPEAGPLMAEVAAVTAELALDESRRTLRVNWGNLAPFGSNPSAVPHRAGPLLSLTVELFA